MAVDAIGGGCWDTAATHAATDRQPNLDRAATYVSAQPGGDRNRRRDFRNGDHRRQLRQVMPMRWLLLGGLLLGRLLSWLLYRRLDRTAGRRRRGRGGRRRCGGGSGRRGRAGTWDVAGALLSLEQLRDAVDDQRDQDQNEQRPANEHRRFAIPRGWLGFLVERVDRLVRFELLRRSFPRGLIGRGRFTGWRLFNHAEVGVPGRLIVEVLRSAIACHGTDGTDPTCEPAQNVFTFSTLTSLSARLGPSSCVDSATNLQLRPLALMVRESWRKLYCGLAADGTRDQVESEQLVD